MKPTKLHFKRMNVTEHINYNVQERPQVAL